MKTLTSILLACVLALFVSTAQAQVDDPLAPSCTVTADCPKSDGEYCNGEQECVDSKCQDINGNNPCDNNGVRTGCKEGDGTYICYETCTVAGDCTDDIYCDGTPLCTTGECVAGTPIDCGAGTCNETTNKCDAAPTPDCTEDADCADNGIYCDGTPVCNVDVCEAGDPIVCAAGLVCDPDVDECVIGECKNDNDCSAPTPECVGTPGNKVCVACDGPEDCSAPTPECVENECVECNGNEDCVDANKCDGDETCVDNACVDGEPVVCTGQTTCEEATGDCVCTADDNCTDGDFCNGEEDCVEGACVDGADPCTGDTPSCDEATDTCAECFVDADCPDEAFCDGPETCQNNLCFKAGNPCGGDTPICDEEKDLCVECAQDSECEDDNPCTGDEICNDGLCESSGSPCEARGLICEQVPVAVAVAIDPTETQQCTIDADCPDAVYCDGVETCVDGFCVEDGNPCEPGEYCDEPEEACFDYMCVPCESDAQCDDGSFCNGVDSCNETTGICDGGDECSDPTPVCDESADVCRDCLEDADCNQTAGEVCDVGESFTCVDCIVDGQCPGGVCSENTCVQCDSNDDCVQDGLACNGPEICTNNNCEPAGFQCPDDLACKEAEGEALCYACESDEECEDGLWCNGENTQCVVAEVDGVLEARCDRNPPCADIPDDIPGIDPDDDIYCHEGLDLCAGCLTQADCADDGDLCNGEEVCRMGKCVSINAPCEGQDCKEVTVNQIETVACVECTEDQDCGASKPYCSNSNTCVECLEASDCPSGEPICSANTCVECLEASDCAEFQTCTAKTCVDVPVNSACDVIVRPKRLVAWKLFKANDVKKAKGGIKVITVKAARGETLFNPHADIDISEFEVIRAYVTKKNVLKILLAAPFGETIHTGVVTVRVGNCQGTLEVVK